MAGAAVGASVAVVGVIVIGAAGAVLGVTGATDGAIVAVVGGIVVGTMGAVVGVIVGETVVTIRQMKAPSAYEDAAILLDLTTRLNHGRESGECPIFIIFDLQVLIVSLAAKNGQLNEQHGSVPSISQGAPH